MNRKIQLVAVFLIISLCSFAQEDAKAKHIVVHTVEAGQTVYSIASAYSLKPDDIQTQNPSVDSTFAIKPGQILRIELPAGAENTASLEHLEKTPILHLVKDDETLYSLSKSYGISVATLQKWNELTDNTIQISDELTVGWRYSNRPKEIVEPIGVAVQTPATQPLKKIVESQPVTPTPKVSPPAPPVSTPTREYYTNNKQGVLKQRFLSDYSVKTKQTEDGPAIWFDTENKMMRDSYYGLYSNAPVGSVVRVTNLRNNIVVYVKIIGSLPNTKENHGAMIKLTQAAKSDLQTVDGKIRVRVDYAD